MSTPTALASQDSSTAAGLPTASINATPEAAPTTPRKPGRPKKTGPDPEPKCPFPKCGKVYTRMGSLKNHLRTMKEDPSSSHKVKKIWRRLDKEGFLIRYTRPKDLTEKERKKRRRAAQKRDRRKHKDERAARKKAKQAARAASGETHRNESNQREVDELKAKAKDHENLLRRAWLVMKDTMTKTHGFPKPLSAKTKIPFTWFVFYDLPSAEYSAMEIPDSSHYHKLVMRFHPDKSTHPHANSYTALINEAWEEYNERMSESDRIESWSEVLQQYGEFMDESGGLTVGEFAEEFGSVYRDLNKVFRVEGGEESTNGQEMDVE